MKPKEYVEVFKMNQFPLSKDSRRKLAKQFESDLEEFPEQARISSKIKMLRQKFDGINSKASYKMTEGFWNFIYATVLVPRFKEEVTNVKEDC